VVRSLWAAERSSWDVGVLVVVRLVVCWPVSWEVVVAVDIDINEEEDVVILRQVQMFFWPWEDDEEFEEMDSPDDESENV
jgi:hypothetical protein